MSASDRSRKSGDAGKGDDSGIIGGKAPATDQTIDAGSFSPDQLMQKIVAQSIAEDDSSDWPRIALENIDAERPLLPFFDAGVMLRIDSPVPNDSFFYLRRGEVEIRNHVGDSIATGMSSGVVRIRGRAGAGSGVCMSGGTLAIYQSAGVRVGAAMTGGGIFVRGDVGPQCGFASTAGTIIVGGNAGKDLGARSRGAAFFVRGEVESLGPDIVEAPNRKQAQLRLSVLLMNASISGKPTEFKRFIHKDELAAEKASFGEVSPSWR